MPSQTNARQATELLLAHLRQIHLQMESMPQQDRNALSDVLKAYNFTAQLPRTPTFATEIRDEWVPTLWYSSLMFTVMGTMTTLCIKHWLMSCTFYPSFFDPDPPEALQDAERLRLRRPSDERKAEMRKARKDTLTKTERIKWTLPYLMYSAVGMFIVGLMAKLGSAIWIACFPS